MRWSLLILLVLSLGCSSSVEPKIRMKFEDIPINENSTLQSQSCTDTLILLKEPNGRKIGNIKYIDFDKRKIIIYDGLRKCLYHFSTSGDFIDYINLEGDNKQTKIDCQHLQIVNDSLVAIFNREYQSIFLYDLKSRTILDTLKIDSYPQSFYLNEENELVLFAPYPMNEYSDLYEVQSINPYNGQKTGFHRKRIKSAHKGLPFQRWYLGIYNGVPHKWDTHSFSIYPYNNRMKPLISFDLGSEKRYRKKLGNIYTLRNLPSTDIVIASISNLHNLFFFTIIQRRIIRFVLADCNDGSCYICRNPNKNFKYLRGLAVNNGNDIPFWPDGSNSKCNMLYQILESSDLIEYARTATNPDLAKYLLQNNIKNVSNPLIRLVYHEKK